MSHAFYGILLIFQCNCLLFKWSMNKIGSFIYEVQVFLFCTCNPNVTKKQVRLMHAIWPRTVGCGFGLRLDRNQEINNVILKIPASRLAKNRLYEEKSTS